MGKFHLTLSRRDFMKSLGLAGAGLATVKVGTPVFHDLDEVISNENSNWRRPWWVKEREFDKPTVDVDWGIYKRFDKFTYAPANARIAMFGQEAVMKANQDWNNLVAKRLQEDTAGFTIRDRAMDEGLCEEGINGGYPAPRTASLPQDLADMADPPIVLSKGRWEGTPEENSRMVRCVLKLAGAGSVAFGVASEDKAEKFIYTHEHVWGDFKHYKIGDYDDIWEDEETRYHPHKCKYMITYTIPESEELLRRAPSNFAEATVDQAYSESRVIFGRMTNFLWALGKYICGGDCSNAHSIHTATAAWTGLSECSRMHQQTISSEFGNIMRQFCIWTDLPLAPTPPIDMGIMRYCLTCKKCADTCPSGAISHEDPTWERAFAPYCQEGVYDYDFSHAKCSQFWKQSSWGCSMCTGSCPFGHKNYGTVHDVISATAAVTPIFNGFFRNMDDLFGYGKNPGMESWWDQEPRYRGLYREIF
ncbi:reductive dehalogenase [Dehalococcoides mccartyi]|uniref:Reductive dehalogenase n=1 Tax=Dehalococcoides mccartyi (strain VS) TaxID=311424 RepID=D2BG05_DEHMV|nr:reductive dehalogenase [Dehalococcoides mccartyi]ACZ61255.1 reductive dehalogenase [Dehalococcoides mccartyi VS]